MNVRLTILLAVLAAMIGSTWAIIEFTDLVFRGESDPDEPWLYHMEESDMIRIEVVHGDNSIAFVRDSGSTQWEIGGDPNVPVFAHRWGGIPLLLSGPRVNRGLKTTIDNPTEYGLDPPGSIVRVTDWAGNTFEFHMGGTTPDGENQYARLVGDQALYTVPAVWAEVVHRLADDPPWGRLYDIDTAIIGVVDVQADDASGVYFSDGAQWLVSPGPPPVDVETSAPAADEWQEWLSILAAPRIDTIVEAYVEDRDTEVLEKYGLAEPPIRIVIARRGQSTVELHLAEGPPDSDFYYARSVNIADNALYSISKSRLEGIESLATDPLADPDWTPPVQDGQTASEGAGEGESSN